MKQGNYMIAEKKLFCYKINWGYFVEELSKTFNLSINEIEWLQNCRTAQLIALIPFIAGCETPERIAFSHLFTYIAEIKNCATDFFSHTKEDNIYIFHRLERLSTFSSGNKTIISEGMNILALIMLENYNNSRIEDNKKNQYNPLNDKAWDYNFYKQLLMTKIQKIQTPEFFEFIKNPILSWR